MKTCEGCKYAQWVRTKNGRLHPSGDGLCTYEYKIPALPASMHWVGSNAPRPSGGHISRRELLKDHCPYWTRED